MITPMKKITILCMESHKQEALEILRDMGILHVTPLKTPVGASLNAAKREVSRIQKVYEAIPSVKNAKSTSGISKAELLLQVQELLECQKVQEETLANAKIALERYKAFGNLDPETIVALESKNIFVRLYTAEANKPFEAEKGAFVKSYAENPDGVCYAVINTGNAPAAILTPHASLVLPEHSIAFYQSEMEKAKAKLHEIENKLASLAAEKDKVKECLVEASDATVFEETASGMLSSGILAAIQGFSPANRLGELQNASKKYGWVVQAEDPSETDEVPTLLSYNKLSKPMQFLYDIIGIAPGYREVDVSSVFLCFFSIFFAMIVGDTAYGLLFLAIALIVRKKMPKANPAGFHFIYLMSGMTILWGVINASFLGLTPDLAHWSYYVDICNYDFLSEPIRNALYWIRTKAPSDPVRFEAYKTFAQNLPFLPQSFVPLKAGADQMQHIQLFCFCIAVVHLSIAHFWNIIVRIKQKSTTALAQVGWLLGTWVMFFLALQMVLGIKMPDFVIPVLCVEVVLLFLFTVPLKRLKQDFISIPMLVLDIVNSFTDVISYIRLFAVGMSGAAIAEAFSEMLSPLFGSAVGVFGAAILLLFVHALNIALAVMGVAVHAVRLNTLEFSNGLGLEWSGFAFKPFSKTKN